MRSGGQGDGGEVRWSEAGLVRSSGRVTGVRSDGQGDGGEVRWTEAGLVRSEQRSGKSWPVGVERSASSLPLLSFRAARLRLPVGPFSHPH